MNTALLLSRHDVVTKGRAEWRTETMTTSGAELSETIEANVLEGGGRWPGGGRGRMGDA